MMIEPPRQRFALTLSYDGSAFHGWQVQPQGLATIQAALEAALGQIAAHPVHTVAAGRTDAGVHATAQVVHFDTTAKRPLYAWVRGVNAHLPPSIAVLAAQPVAADFSARFDACARRYRYVLLNESIRPALLAGKVGWTFRELDVTKMQAAAQYLLGEHDFSSFRAAECQAKSPVKHLYQADVYRQHSFVCFDFQASAFLHHMVRNLVGALVYVGRGKLSVADFAALIQARDRALAPPTFMADGLYLTGVAYPAHFGLASAPVPRWLWGRT